MDDRPREEAPSEATLAWATARRVREPVAWTLLVLTAIGVVVSAGQLLGIVGVPIPVAAPISIGSSASVSVSTFALRASAMGPQFVDFGLVTLPVFAVILVAFAGGLTDRARQVVQAAVSVETVGLAFGVISWLGAVGGRVRPDAWFVFFAVDLAIGATALVFVTAVMRSPALQRPAPRYQGVGDDEDEAFEGDDQDAADAEDIGGDEVDFGSH